MTYRYARDRALTLLEGGAYIERRPNSHRSKATPQDVYYLVWNQPQDNAGLCEVHERRMWRGTFFALLKDKSIIAKWEPRMRGLEKSEAEPTKWVLK